MDKVTWWHFQSTSKEVIWPKNFLNYIHGLKSALLLVPPKELEIFCQDYNFVVYVTSYLIITCSKTGSTTTNLFVWVGLGVSNAPTNDFTAISLNGELEYNLPRFPVVLEDAAYLLWGNNPLLCGGQTDGSIVDSCFFLPDMYGSYLTQNYLQCCKQLCSKMALGEVGVSLP